MCWPKSRGTANILKIPKIRENCVTVNPSTLYCYTFASSFLSSFSCTVVHFGELKATWFSRSPCPNKFQTLISKAPVKLACENSRLTSSGFQTPERDDVCLGGFESRPMWGGYFRRLRWSGLGARRWNWRQVCETGTCLRTSGVWSNGFASRLMNSRKSLKVVTILLLLHICECLAINLYRLALGGQMFEGCVDLYATLSSIKMKSPR